MGGQGIEPWTFYLSDRRSTTELPARTKLILTRLGRFANYEEKFCSRCCKLVRIRICSLCCESDFLKIFVDKTVFFVSIANRVIEKLDPIISRRVMQSVALDLGECQAKEIARRIPGFKARVLPVTCDEAGNFPGSRDDGKFWLLVRSDDLPGGRRYESRDSWKRDL